MRGNQVGRIEGDIIMIVREISAVSATSAMSASQGVMSCTSRGLPVALEDEGSQVTA
jgi:hypothetical protein